MPAEESVDFYDAKGIVEELLDKLRVAATFGATVDEQLVVGRAAEVRSGDQPLGVVGQVHPARAAELDISGDVYLFELRLDALLPFVGSRPGYRPFSRFPATEQDIALVVDRELQAAQIEAILRQGRFVVGVRPFDVYTGAPIPEGKKSIAFSLRYQADDHTLTDEEVDRSRNRTIQQLRQQLGATLRDG